MMTQNEMLVQLSLIGEETERRLSAAIQNVKGPEKLCEAMAYSLLAGGKHIRASLLVETSRLLGSDDEAVWTLACALEMIHTYSLIHDDLPAMDNDTLRRGKPTCHCVYGEAQALLAGDALLNLAFETMLQGVPNTEPEAYIQAMRRIAQSSGAEGMCGGQHLDLYFTGRFATVEALRQMHALKTGALLHSAVMAAVDLAQADQQTAAALSAFAQAYGLLFQITDDILDETGNAALMGKSLGKDAAEGKTTYVTLFGLEKARMMADEICTQGHEALRSIEKDTAWFDALLDYTLTRNH